MARALWGNRVVSRGLPGVFCILCIFALFAPYAFGAPSSVSYSSYTLYTYREVSYGVPPNGVSSTDGCHIVFELAFDDEVVVTDADALDGSLLFSGSTGTMWEKTYDVKGNTLVIDIATEYMPGGRLTVTARNPDRMLDGISVGGLPLSWETFDSIVPTGLSLRTVSVVEGTATTCASTTVEVDHSANIRSMNHVLWTSDGTAILGGTGTAQTTAAHHHDFWGFSLVDSANSIQSSAAAPLVAAGYDVTYSEDTVTITAKRAAEGEILGIYNFDDDFLQANGFSLSDAVTGLAAPTVNGVAGISLRCTVVPVGTQAYTGSAVSPSFSVVDGYYGVLTEGEDYEVSYANNTEVGEASYTITGINDYAGSLTGTFRIAYDIALLDAVISVDTQVYTGEPLEPSVAIRNATGALLVEGVDYTVAHNDNVEAGTAYVTITGCGEYAGTFVRTFAIINQAESLDGVDRFATAVSVAKETYPDGAQGVILAYAYDFPDALAASALVGAYDYPILLVESNAIPSVVQDYLNDEDIQNIFIVGGDGVVGSIVKNTLERQGRIVARLAGSDRFGTAEAIYEQITATYGISCSDTAVVVNGYTFPDALSISPYSVATTSPLFLTAADKTLSPENIGTIISNFENVIIVGGTGVVSQSTEMALVEGLGQDHVTRCAGADRYETSLVVARRCVDAGVLVWNKVAFATGLNYADALSGSSLCGKNTSVLLLINDETDAGGGSSCLGTLGTVSSSITKIYYLGGAGALPEALRDDIVKSLGW